MINKDTSGEIFKNFLQMIEEREVPTLHVASCPDHVITISVLTVKRQPAINAVHDLDI